MEMFEKRPTSVALPSEHVSIVKTARGVRCFLQIFSIADNVISLSVIVFWECLGVNVYTVMGILVGSSLFVEVCLYVMAKSLHAAKWAKALYLSAIIQHFVQMMMDAVSDFTIYSLSEHVQNLIISGVIIAGMIVVFIFLLRDRVA